ncbi:hypothetical protein KC332_g34 [Hortaea werneckii]|nr:hypothetical protein KC332_g34 [Hortaea werneckii]
MSGSRGASFGQLGKSKRRSNGRLSNREIEREEQRLEIALSHPAIPCHAIPSHPILSHTSIYPSQVKNSHCVHKRRRLRGIRPTRRAERLNGVATTSETPSRPTASRRAEAGEREVRVRGQDGVFFSALDGGSRAPGSGIAVGAIGRSAHHSLVVGTIHGRRTCAAADGGGRGSPVRVDGPLGDGGEVASVGSFGGRAGARREVFVRVVATVVVSIEGVTTSTIQAAGVMMVMKASVIFICSIAVRVVDNLLSTTTLTTTVTIRRLRLWGYSRLMMVGGEKGD